MEPSVRLEDGTPLWLTGEIRTPAYNEYYWTSSGVAKKTSGSVRSKYPVLTDKPSLPDPYLAGRIDEVLTFSWGESSNYACARAKELMKQARKHLWGAK